MLQQPSVTGDLASLSLAQSPQAEQWFSRLLVANEGVLFEDSQIQIGVRSEYRGPEGRMMFFYGNKGTAALTDFSVAIPPSIDVTIQQTQVPTSIAPRTQIKQVFALACTQPFVEPPQLNVSFRSPSTNEMVTVTVRLPVVAHKFFVPANPTRDEFFNLWRQVNAGTPMEVQMTITPPNLTPQSLANMARMLTAGFHLAALPGYDPNPNNMLFCGLFHSKGAPPTAVQLRVETNLSATPPSVQLTAHSLNAVLVTAMQRHVLPQLGKI